MSAVLVMFIVGLIAGLVCIGGFLWSAMEQRPQKMWLVGAAAAILVGIAGLVLHK